MVPGRACGDNGSRRGVSTEATQDAYPWMHSRREFLLTTLMVPVSAAAGSVAQSERRVIVDPTTEFRMVRLTDPSHASLLPAPANRAVARRGQFLVYSADRDGVMQPHRVETGSGMARQICQAEGLKPESLFLTADDKMLFFADSAGIHRTPFSGREREVYHWEEGYEGGSGLGLSLDGRYAAAVETKPSHWRLRLVNMRNGPVTLVETGEPISFPSIRPRRDSVAYRRGDSSLWLVNFDGSQNRKLALGAGGLGPVFWSPDGKSVLYLSIPEDPTHAVAIREFFPDTNQDRWVTDTSKYATFAPNGDASVFAGASASKASPYLSLLVRRAHRELTIAEHRASDARLVTTMFSPNSQRLFFQTDREGKMSIYMMNTERLVAATED